jgi:hypothetical protein
MVKISKKFDGQFSRHWRESQSRKGKVTVDIISFSAGFDLSDFDQKKEKERKEHRGRRVSDD